MRIQLLIFAVLLCISLSACKEAAPVETARENAVETAAAVQTAEGTQASAAVQTAEGTQASADANQITLTSVAAAKGETFSTDLSVKGTVDFCALDLKILYDADKLTFVGFADLDEDVVANCNGEGTVFVNFLRTKNVTRETALCGIRFAVKSDEICETVCRIEPTEIVRLDAAEEIEHCVCTVKNGVISLNGGETDAG